MVRWVNKAMAFGTSLAFLAVFAVKLRWDYCASNPGRTFGSAIHKAYTSDAPLIRVHPCDPYKSVSHCDELSLFSLEMNGAPWQSGRYGIDNGPTGRIA
jgi:hypothetical protein